MPQVFVVRQELINETESAPVVVYAQYSDTAAIDIGLHGATMTKLTVADGKIAQHRPSMVQPTLRSGWRDDYVPVINAEAERRINKVFPEFKQRNYNALMNDYTNQYGADPAQWPQEAKDAKVENDRGWQYVKDVRAVSNSFTQMPLDPTADAQWPPEITPIA